MATEITGVGENDIFQNDGLRFIAKSVAGGDTLQSNASRDIARVNGVNFFALIGMHAQQTANALARALGGIKNVTAGFKHTRIDAHES